jgi:hypothetical protein
MSYSFLNSIRAVYRPVDFFEVGLGYEFIYATGLCLSYKKMNPGVQANSDNRTPHNANVWYQGVSLRVSFSL